jgi:hypothetical protein
MIVVLRTRFQEITQGSDETSDRAPLIPIAPVAVKEQGHKWLGLNRAIGMHDNPNDLETGSWSDVQSGNAI